MTSTLIRGAEGICAGRPGDAMRARGAIRIADGRIAAIGELSAEPGERIIDASGCVIYPGLVSTHHHLFQSILKGVRGGINLPLMGWLRAVPHAYWSEIGEDVQTEFAGVPEHHGAVLVRRSRQQPRQL